MYAALAMALALLVLPVQTAPSTQVTPPNGNNPIYVPAAQVTVTCDEFASTTGDSAPVNLVRDVSVKAGQTFAITLCSNASTGFSWEEPVFDHAALALIDHSAAAPRDPIPGAPGTETWKFSVIVSGNTSVGFTYSQPWSGGTKGAWTLALNVKATKPSGLQRSLPCDAQGSPTGLVRLDPITLRVGQKFSLTLCSNPSTGFSWQRAYLGNGQVQLISHTTAASTSGLLGAPGTETWTYKAVKPGTRQLVFWYLRPWESSQRLAVVWLSVRVTK